MESEACYRNILVYAFDSFLRVEPPSFRSYMYIRTRAYACKLWKPFERNRTIRIGKASPRYKLGIPTSMDPQILRRNPSIFLALTDFVESRSARLKARHLILLSTNVSAVWILLTVNRNDNEQLMRIFNRSISMFLSIFAVNVCQLLRKSFIFSMFTCYSVLKHTA